MTMRSALRVGHRSENRYHVGTGKLSEDHHGWKTECGVPGERYTLLYDMAHMDPCEVCDLPEKDICTIYFVLVRHDGQPAVKIGHTFNFSERLRNLRSKSAEDLRLRQIGGES